MAGEKQVQRIVALDIGTNKIAAIVANVTAHGELEIIGIGTHQSRGLKKGVVVNIDSTVQSIQRAIEEAELMSGCEIDSVYAGIAGSHIRSLNSHGIVAIRDGEVYAQDIDRVIDAAKAMAIPADQKNPPRVTPGIHHRFSGRGQRTAGHVRGEIRGQGAYGDLCRERSAKHRKVY